jgi:hypothetical protein
MEIFSTLESQVARLIDAHASLKQRVVVLEAENVALRSSADAGDVSGLKSRIAALESERTEILARLEKLLRQVEAIEL